MNIPLLLLMLVAGTIIGAGYFGGLWFTLQRMTNDRNGALWLIASFLLRSSMTMAAFWLLAAGEWQRILALALGFITIRFLSIKRIQQLPGHSL